MKGSYLLRFDDLCPTMNWDVWTEVERNLLESGVRPILAVVPDNRDDALSVSPAEPRFWEHVREWQARGWTIGLHGYQHRYVTADRGMFGWNDRSEFAGLPADEQEEKIQAGLRIFARERVQADVWVAPNHSFDPTTLDVLRGQGIAVVSDGLGIFPHTDREGTTWVPMQLWSFEERPLGVWTVCMHHNAWGEEELRKFRDDLRAFGGRLTDLPSVLEAHAGRRRSLLDRGFAGQRRLKRRVRMLADRRRSEPAASRS